MPDTAPVPDRAAARLAEIRERGYRNGASGVLAAYLSDWADADVPALLAAVEAVLALHVPYRIYSECAHADGEHEDSGITPVDCGDFVTCEDGYLYSGCRECCTDEGYQTEACADGHHHAPGEAICATVAAITRALLGEDGADAAP
jgi:hypothetical protein